jgi:hypothetical protein
MIQPRYKWLTLNEAAAILKKTVAALRRMIQRKMVRGRRGVIEAQFPGVLARKFGGRWRVCLSDVWA